MVLIFNICFNTFFDICFNTFFFFFLGFSIFYYKVFALFRAKTCHFWALEGLLAGKFFSPSPSLLKQRLGWQAGVFG